MFAELWRSLTGQSPKGSTGAGDQPGQRIEVEEEYLIAGAEFGTAMRELYEYPPTVRANTVDVREKWAKAEQRMLDCGRATIPFQWFVVVPKERLATRPAIRTPNAAHAPQCIHWWNPSRDQLRLLYVTATEEFFGVYRMLGHGKDIHFDFSFAQWAQWERVWSTHGATFPLNISFGTLTPDDWKKPRGQEAVLYARDYTPQKWKGIELRGGVWHRLSDQEMDEMMG